MCGEGWQGADCGQQYYEPGRKISDIATGGEHLSIDALLDGAKPEVGGINGDDSFVNDAPSPNKTTGAAVAKKKGDVQKDEGEALAVKVAEGLNKTSFMEPAFKSKRFDADHSEGLDIGEFTKFIEALAVGTLSNPSNPSQASKQTALTADDYMSASPESIQAVFSEFDLNKDGQVTYPEAMGALQNLLNTVADEPAESAESAEAAVALATTVLTLDAHQGGTELEVSDASIFGIGDTVGIGSLTNYETNKVAGFGSVILSSPLEQNHSIGELVFVTERAVLSDSNAIAAPAVAAPPAVAIPPAVAAMTKRDSGSSPSAAAANRLEAESSSGLICGEGGLCSDHGTCDTVAGKCICDLLFSGDACQEQHCPGFEVAGIDCHGHGVCETGSCRCAQGWGLVARGNETADTLDSCRDQICPIGCGEHGACVNGTCQCDLGWTGPNCKDPHCLGGCNGHGECTFTSPHSPGECTCEYGFSGTRCERQALYMQMHSCQNDCSGNGLCMDGRCDCNVGFTGADCSEKACLPGFTGPDCDLQLCPGDCHGQGLCMAGQCACWQSFTGKDCSVPLQCYEPCRSSCEVDPAAEACLFCVGHCTTSLLVSPNNHGLGIHNPLEDIWATMIQVPEAQNQKQHVAAVSEKEERPRRLRQRRQHNEVSRVVLVEMNSSHSSQD
jgi:hypothetical protein